MTEVKRLCPVCGAANSMERERCEACGADFRSDLPVPIGEMLPITWKRVGASLALGVAALAVKAGLNLVSHLLERKTVKPTEFKVRKQPPAQESRWVPRRIEKQKTARRQARVRFRGWRAWGSWRSDGVSQVEVEELYWHAEQ